MTNETESNFLGLAEQFEAERPRLRAVALRILGSDAGADDAVQEAWIRLVRTDARSAEGGEEIANLPGWLTTVVSRICLDVLRSRTTRREEAWPDEADFVDTAPSPEDEAELADAVGQAMTVVLDSLSPAERLAYVLKDVFDVPFEEIARVLGRTEVATRQLASRARRRLREPEPREDLAAADAAVVDAFMKAARDNEFEALLELLDPEAAVRPDAAALAMGGQATTLVGGRAVADFFAGRAAAALPATLDGGAASCWQHKGEIKVVFGFTVVDGKVVEIEVLANPDVLTRAARRSPHRS
jgi:RNA polymerase sigma-70 factor (ECF subfamily)